MSERPRTGAAAPLDGLLVIALEQAVAAPFASRQLADLGARVIKIERPDGGDFARGYDAAVHGESSYFVWLNRGKESVRIDLKDDEDRGLVDRLLAQSDVFIQNLAPGATERLGLGATTLRERYPRLVTCTISGYGEDGPYAAAKAYDLLVQCEAGLLSVTGTPEEPVKVGVSIVDIATGMYAYTGILTALLQRQISGEGAHVDVTMLDAIGEWMVQPYLYTAYSDRQLVRTGARHASIAPYGPFRLGDGARVFLAVQNEREWRRFCDDILGQHDLADDERFRSNSDRASHVQELTEQIERLLNRFDRSSLLTALGIAGIASAELRCVADLMSHPQLRARKRWGDIATPGGTARVPLPPAVVEGVPPRLGAVPALGEHDRSIRQEFS